MRRNWQSIAELVAQVAASSPDTVTPRHVTTHNVTTLHAAPLPAGAGNDDGPSDHAARDHAPSDNTPRDSAPPVHAARGDAPRVHAAHDPTVTGPRGTDRSGYRTRIRRELPHVSLYAHPKVLDAIRDLAIAQRKKPHDLYIEGLRMMLASYGLDFEQLQRG